MIGSDSFDDMQWEAPFLARITAKVETGGIWYYAWTEQMFDVESGGYVDASPPGRSGTTTVSRAREINNTEISAGELPKLVHMNFRAIFQGEQLYEFCACGVGGGGTGSLTVSDGFTNYVNTSFLGFNVGTGLTLSAPSPGEVQVLLSFATTSSAGTLSTTTQDVGGLKKFRSGAHGYNSSGSGATYVSIGTVSSGFTDDIQEVGFWRPAWSTSSPVARIFAYRAGIAGTDTYNLFLEAGMLQAYVTSDPNAGGTHAFVVKKSGGGAIYGIHDGTTLYSGITGTGGGGDTIVGGIVTALGTGGGTGGLTIGTTPITGATDGYVLLTSGGVLTDTPILTLTTAAGGITVNYPP